MPFIHFVSGKKLEITEKEFNAMPTKLMQRGIRMHRTEVEGHFIPLNSNTIEFVENVLSPEEERVKKTEERIAEAEELARKLTEKMQEKEEKPEPEPEKTHDQKAKEAMDEMIAKSNCTHGNKTLHVQATKQGRKYFPVCDFCGKRERFVSVQKIKDGEIADWTADDILNAKDWVEK